MTSVIIKLTFPAPASYILYKENIMQITPEVVSSAEYLPLAAIAAAEAFKQYNPSHPHNTVLQQWKETGGHLPVVWGSGMACDAPYLLNKMVQEDASYEDILSMAIRLLIFNDSIAWQEAYRLAKAAGNASIISSLH
jgi:hypothetical protein